MVMCKLPIPHDKSVPVYKRIIDHTLTLTPFVLGIALFGGIIYNQSNRDDILLDNPLTIKDNANERILVYDKPQDSWPNHLVDENMDWIPDYREWKSVERTYSYMRTVPTREDSLLFNDITKLYTTPKN